MKGVLRTTHLIIGLAACAFLVILSLTGTVMVFENELNRTVNPQLLKVRPISSEGSPLAWDDFRRKVEQQVPAWRVQRIYMPANVDDSTYVRLASRADGHTDEIYANQYTGRVLGRKLGGNQIIWKIHELHINLGAGTTGGRFVVGSSIALLCLAVSGLYLWWPHKIFRLNRGGPWVRANFDLHRSLGFWSSIAMVLFAVTGINLHIQTGGTLFDMMDQKSAGVHMPGHGTTVDAMLQSAREAVPGATTMRISFWNDKRPVLVQMRFPEDHTPAGRTAVTLDPRTGEVLTAVSSRTAPLVYTALVQWNREIHTGTVFGLPSKVVMALCSFLLSVLAFTGPMIWINKKVKRLRGRRTSVARQQELVTS